MVANELHMSADRRVTAQCGCSAETLEVGTTFGPSRKVHREIAQMRANVSDRRVTLTKGARTGTAVETEGDQWVCATWQVRKREGISDSQLSQGWEWPDR